MRFAAFVDLFRQSPDTSILLTQGKDEQHLCSLTAYDFYLVTKVPAKAPKGSYFALKSRLSGFARPSFPATYFIADQDSFFRYYCTEDQSAFFEDASDFIHLFATDSRTFDRMYRGILDARVSC